MMRLDREPPTDEQTAAEAEVASFLEAIDELAVVLDVERARVVRALTAVVQRRAKIERLIAINVSLARSRIR